MARVSKRQAINHYVEVMDQLQPALTATEQAVNEIAAQLAADTGEDPAVTDRLIQAGCGYTQSAFELRLAIAEASVNLDAVRGGRRLAAQEHAAQVPELQAYQQVADAWKQRVIERGLTAPEVRDDVHSAALAHSELRDIHRANGDGRLDAAGARRRIVDVAARFQASRRRTRRLARLAGLRSTRLAG